jgi:hypothetical protein
MNLYPNSAVSDDVRRQALYEGAIFVYSPCPSAIKLCELARTMVQEAFHPLDPLVLHENLPVEQCVETLAVLKPKFIHHPKSKEYLRGILSEVGCDLNKTYFDVPRMRTAFPGDYLKSGIAYAFHPHRDTWYSAPFCQINWWMPFFPFNSENSMALHPGYWDRPLKNSSNIYNYARWDQESRHNAAQHVKADTRVQPKPQESVELDPQVRVICDVGGIYLFSAAQLHSTVPNTSGQIRYSIDFRTVYLDDAIHRIGASNLDSACTGTTLNDYMRAADFAPMPQQLVAQYVDEPALSR